MDIREELKSAGVYPTGPCSAWPESRNVDLIARQDAYVAEELKKRGKAPKAKRVNASLGKMAKGMVSSGISLARHGKVSAEIREERYDTCKACPFFIEDSKRCSDCGCFMEAKTWVGGDPKMLCPQKRWSR